MLSRLSPDRQKFTALLLLAVCILISAYLFLLAFRRLPVDNTTLGLDWRTIWEGIQRGQVTYGNTRDVIGGLYTPPWGILLLLPLGFLSFKDSWALFSFISTLLLILSVPRLKNNRLDFPAILLLVLSFPALRNLADGNMESLVITGIVLVMSAYNLNRPWLLAIGLLLATIKFQETWLFCLVALILILKNWSRPQLVRVFALLGGVVTFSMLLWGEAWLRALLGNPAGTPGLSSAMGRGSLIDITLAAALSRLGVPAWLIGGAWAALFLLTLGSLFYAPPKQALGWQHATLLVASSMLLAPYLSGNSVLTLTAVGIIPLFQQNRAAGLFALLLVNLPYLANREMMFWYSSYYWSMLLLLMWILAWQKVFRSKARDPNEAIPPFN